MCFFALAIFMFYVDVGVFTNISVKSDKGGCVGGQQCNLDKAFKFVLASGFRIQSISETEAVLACQSSFH